jgi:uncharacterized membrane protein
VSINHETPRWRRILAHRWYDDTDTKRALSAAAVEHLESQVTASERKHSGEICVCVESSLPMSYLWQRLTARDRALTMFGKLRVWDTEANNGVLIYLLLVEHHIEIVADRGLARLVPQAEWDALLDGMRGAFRAGRFEEGLREAIAGVDALLTRHFPLAPGAPNPDELPNRVWIG